MPALSFILTLAFMAGALFLTYRLAGKAGAREFLHVTITDEEYHLHLMGLTRSLSHPTSVSDLVVRIDRIVRALHLGGVVIFPLGALVEALKVQAGDDYAVTTDHLDEFKTPKVGRLQFALFVCCVGTLLSAYTLGRAFGG